MSVNNLAELAERVYDGGNPAELARDLYENPRKYGQDHVGDSENIAAAVRYVLDNVPVIDGVDHDELIGAWAHDLKSAADFAMAVWELFPTRP